MSDSCPHIAGSITANTNLRLHCGLDYLFAPVTRVTLQRAKRASHGEAGAR